VSAHAGELALCCFYMQRSIGGAAPLSDPGVTFTGRSASNARSKVRQCDGGTDSASVCRIGIYVPAPWAVGTSPVAER
jgi:hypothetical protein